MDAIQIIDGYIQLKHGTSTEWATENPVLLAWELGIETNTRKCKIGDGRTAWNSLPYAFSSTPAFASIDTNNLIYTIYDDVTNWASNGIDVSYTATENCFIVGFGANGVSVTPSKTAGILILVNDVLVQQIIHSTTGHTAGAPIFLPLAVGDKVTIKSSSSTKAYVYAYGVKYT